MVGSSESGGLPTHNFRDGVFSGVENISAEAVKRDLNGRMEGCYTCPIRCKKVVEAEAPYRIDPQYGGPEYEALGALGSCCGVSDLPAVAKANELCNAYSLDVISTGVSIAFLMECYEEGLIGPADTDGLDLRFGHGEALVEMVERIARREGIGEFAAEGVKRMALHLGPKAEPWAVHIKGQEAPMHDPRARSPQLSLGYVLSPTGADHVHTTNWNILKNCLGLCEILPYDREQVATLVNAVTDWGLAPEDLDTVGERAMDLARVFNTREGLTAEDDRTAPRFATPFASGPRQGQFIDVEALEQAKQEYYEKMGWDPQRAVPTRARLETLGIGWAADWLASA
jgi:aldehyde:ferredoxin oxidoreductase